MNSNFRQYGDMDYYEILGVKETASVNEIRKAYLRQSLKVHPDKHPEQKDRVKANEAFVRLKTAYDVLYDASQRFLYDMFRKRTRKPPRQTPPPPPPPQQTPPPPPPPPERNDSKCGGGGGRIYGMNKTNGKPCKRCQNQGSFCYHHRDQDPKGSAAKGNSRDTPPPKRNRNKVFGRRKDGAPCTRCQLQGRFCFQHVSQQ